MNNIRKKKRSCLCYVCLCLVLLGGGGLGATVLFYNTQPSIVLIGQTKPEATITVVNKGITFKTVADEKGCFEKELFNIDADHPNIVTLYAEKNGIQGKKKVLTLSFPIDVETLTVSGIILDIPKSVAEITTPSCNNSGDLNDDGEINFKDLSTFLFYWGTSRCEADLNRNHRVDFGDLSILLNRWGAVVKDADK